MMRRLCGMEPSTDPEDDITDDTNSSNPAITYSLLDTDAAECSSSFDTTSSSSDAPNVSRITEVQSTAFHRHFHSKKKKPTKHWRNYISPLAWRCKWAELRIMQLESQGLTYARELALFKDRKLWELDHDSLEYLSSKSYPYIHQYRTNNVMKRRKRRKIEDTIDVASYISAHNLFSFIENKKNDLDSFTTGGDVFNIVNLNKKAHSCSQLGIRDYQPLALRDWNSGVEGIFEKLEKIQSRVHKLKTQLETVMSEHVAIPSSSEDMSLVAPFDGLCSSNHSPTLSMGGTYPPTHCISDFDLGNFGFPESAISGFEETIYMDENIVEGSAAVLSAANATSSNLQIMGSDQQIVDDAVVDKNFVDAESPRSNPTALPQEPQSEEAKIEFRLTHLAPVPDAAVVHHGPSPLESPLGSDFAPKNKRKRGERKVSSGSWIKRYSISDSE